MRSVNQPAAGTLARDFSSGSIMGKLIMFTLPLFVSNLLQIVYNVADMLFISQFAGSEGISALSVGGDLTNCPTMILMGFATGGQVIIAQYLGAKQNRLIGRFVGTMATFLTACSLVISVLCLVARPQLLGWMSTPAESWAMADAYVSITMSGMVFICGYNIVSAILRALGDSKHPLLFIAISTVVNVALDWLFIARFGWGAAGAAVATVVAQAVSFLLSLGFLYRRRAELSFTVTARDFRVDRGELGMLVRLGLPIALKTAAVQFSKLFANSFINSYGVVVSAVSGITNKINSVSNLFSNALNVSGATMVGQNIGAGEYDRVRKTIGRIAVITLLTAAATSAVMLLWPKAVFGAFTGEAEVLRVCMEYVPVSLLMFLGTALRTPFNALINGSGNYRVNLLVAILDGLVLRIGLCLLLGLAAKLGYIGFWLGDAIASFTPFVVGVVFLSSGRWKTRKYVTRQQE